ncbi:unnamed protein product, partial [Staurois parvus]
PIRADRIGDRCTDHQCSPISTTCQCPSTPPVSAHQRHLSVPINATCQCSSELPYSATYQCQSVPPNSTNFQCPSVMSECPPVMPVNAHQCHLPVPTHQWPSMPPVS